MIQPLFFILFADIMSWIHVETCEKEQRIAFFAEYYMMQLGCDEGLIKDEITYLEDLAGFFFDKIIVIAVENLYYCDWKIVKAKAYLQ